MREPELQAIYLGQIQQAGNRLVAALRYLGFYAASPNASDLESATLQVRKALEMIAYAAIAPDKKTYSELRARATESSDFTRDYHAKKIFTALARINPDFYPIPLQAPTQTALGSWHFERQANNALSKSRFEAIYDRLGKHLHAHNPWSRGKALENLVGDLPEIIEQIRGLLDRHARFIRYTDYHAAWVVELDRATNTPRLIVGEATGPFLIQRGR